VSRDSYLVTWTMDFEADDPIEAAKEARELLLDPQATCTVFQVQKIGGISPRGERLYGPVTNVDVDPQGVETW
jgi:hypothetical protein